MNRDDIICMVREAGLYVGTNVYEDSGLLVHFDFDDIERFAALVAAAARESMKADGWRACAVGQRETQHCGLLESAVLVEREACARVCDDIDKEYEGEDVLATWCAAAIRARGEG